MFILRRTLMLSRNALTKDDLPAPNTYQLHWRLLATDKSQSTKMPVSNREVSYDDMLKIINEPKKTIIDVRNPDEVVSTGMIPRSINIPLDHIKTTLSMSESEFLRRYNHNKPSSNDEIVFYCKSGKRSAEALEQAIKMGYQKSKTYPGSWDEWSSKLN